MITITKMVPVESEEIEEFWRAWLLDWEGTPRFISLHLVKPSYWTWGFASVGVFKILDLGPVSFTWNLTKTPQHS